MDEDGHISMSTISTISVMPSIGLSFFPIVFFHVFFLILFTSSESDHIPNTNGILKNLKCLEENCNYFFLFGCFGEK